MYNLLQLQFLTNHSSSPQFQHCLFPLYHNSPPTISLHSDSLPAIPLHLDSLPTIPLLSNSPQTIPLLYDTLPTVHLLSDSLPTIPLLSDSLPTVPLLSDSPPTLLSDSPPTIPLLSDSPPAVPLLSDSLPFSSTVSHQLLPFPLIPHQLFPIHFDFSFSLWFPTTISTWILPHWIIWCCVLEVLKQKAASVYWDEERKKRKREGGEGRGVGKMSNVRCQAVHFLFNFLSLVGDWPVPVLMQSDFLPSVFCSSLETHTKINSICPLWMVIGLHAVAFFIF